MAWVDQQPNILATAALIIALNIFFVTVRFRFRQSGRGLQLGWDDWLALGALVLNVAQCSVVIYWVYIGLGKHIETVTTPASQLLKAIFIFEILYAWALYFIKLSALCFYGRMFHIIKGFKTQLWLAGALVTAWIITVTFLSVFSCVPVQKSWYPNIPGHCIYLYGAYITNGVISAFTDVLIVLLPLPILWKLEMDLRKRIGIIIIFIASYATCAVSILRTAFVGVQGKEYDEDFTYNLSPGVILAVLEPGWGLICICLPAVLGFVNIGFRRYSLWASERRSKKSSELMLRPASYTQKTMTTTEETTSFP